jgi:hypothetical protein
MKPGAYHREVLTPAQQRVLTASAPFAERWGAHLAGGAAAGLYFGHRRSVDLDFFTPKTLPPPELLDDLRAVGARVDIKQNTEGTFVGVVDGVQYSVFRYRYPLLKPPASIDRCNVVSLDDLAAMKLAAICGRAVRKDYIDLHALLTKARMPLPKMLAAYRAKFSIRNVASVVRALSYFVDAEREPMPIMLVNTTWEEIKKTITRAAQSLSVSR